MSNEPDAAEMAAECPYCSAGLLSEKTCKIFTCGARVSSGTPYQSVQCKLNVAQAELARLREREQLLVRVATLFRRADTQPNCGWGELCSGCDHQREHDETNDHPCKKLVWAGPNCIRPSLTRFWLVEPAHVHGLLPTITETVELCDHFEAEKGGDDG